MTILLKAVVSLVVLSVVTKTSSALTYNYKLPPNCNSRYHSTNYDGIAVSAALGHVYSVNHCASLCSDYSDCNCYSYYHVGHVCYLRRSCFNPGRHPHYISGTCAPDPPPAPCYRLPETCSMTHRGHYWAHYFLFGVVTVSMKSEAQCAGICSTFQGCTCYSYYPFNGGQCRLMKNCRQPAPNREWSSGTCTPSPLKHGGTMTAKTRPKTKREYYMPAATGVWQGASDYCENKGDRLAVIKTWADNEAAIDACTTTNPFGCWIGLTASKVTHDPTELDWEDGSKNTGRFASVRGEFPWFNGEPNNADGNELCIAMVRKFFQMWDDRQCDNPRYNINFLCERVETKGELMQEEMHGEVLGVQKQGIEGLGWGWTAASVGVVVCVSIGVVVCLRRERSKQALLGWPRE